MLSTWNPAKKINRAMNRFKRKAAERRQRKLIENYNFSGYKRFYHYHIRKTAGTSLAQSFLGLNGQDGQILFKRLGQQSNRPLVEGEFIFVGWDQPLIESGNYFFAFSHYCFDELRVPPNTFIFTSFRDPVDRVLSHYRMLIDFSRDAIKHPCFAEEGQWLGNSFEEFLERIPQRHLLNQLFMFSDQFDIEQAKTRIEALDHVFWFEQLNFSLAEFKKKTGIELPIRHERKSRFQFEISADLRQKLTSKLEPEYELLSRVRKT